MARVGRTLPAFLSFLVLGAHFFRAAHYSFAVCCVVAAGLAFVRRCWLVAALRVGLVAGSALWVHTAWVIAQSRREAGSPYVRMLVILGAVALFTAFAAWLLPPASTPRPRDPERS